MTSAHTTLRELVAHLARAQRACEAGRIEEAERALGDALALDPNNVQAADLRQRLAADLRQRLAKSRQPPASPALDTVEPPGPAERGHRSRPASGRPAGRVSAAAWSTFEQRVRERRAERAVAQAQEALARGDQDAAAAALAELDSVSPHDRRRVGIAAALAPREPERVTVAAATTAPSVSRVHVSPTPRPADIGAIPLDRGLSCAAEPRHTVTPVQPRTRSWARAAAACAAIAATAGLGFWLFTPRPGDLLWTPAATERPSTSERQAPVDSGSDLDVAPEATAPLSGLLDNGSQLPVSDEAAVAPGELVDASQGGDLGRPADSVPAPGLNPRADEAAPPVTPPRAPLDRRLPESASLTSTRSLDRSPEIGRAEPAPAPLEAPVQSPIVAPDTRRTPDPGAGGRAVTPVPEPPAAALLPAPTPPVATASRGETETRAVRGVLDGYADAFSTLDANATQRVWPAVDLRGLRRAFDQLTAQTITFNRCDVNASGETAEAVCVGKATWVPKVGDRSPKSEARTWRFALGRDAGEWVIDKVEVQR